MAEAIVNETQSIETGGELPGGFKSVEDMYTALRSTKADLGTHKTRADAVTAAEKELEELRKDKADREAASMSELEKVQAEYAALEKTIAEKDTAILKSQRLVLLERVLSTRLAQYDESARDVARDMYQLAALGDYTDEESLNSLLDPVDEKLHKLVQPASTGGARSVMGPVSSPSGKPNPQAAAAAKEWLGMSFTERAKVSAEQKRR